MLNEHTLKIKQFFRKLIITNKCYVKKLHIWLFWFDLWKICEFFRMAITFDVFVRKNIWFCWLLSSNMFDLISDFAKTTNILKIFWFYQNRRFFHSIYSDLTSHATMPKFLWTQNMIMMSKSNIHFCKNSWQIERKGRKSYA